jgi:hypothetical protein
MSAAVTMTRRGRLAVWLLVIAGLLVVGVANWHLVHVATTSEPDCVAHLRPGEGHGEQGVFSAAQSSCSP